MAETAAPPKEKKPPRKYPTILVVIPGFPAQDPGRRMIYTIRPTEGMAMKMAKRLARKMPEYEWSVDMLTHAESLSIKRAPIRLSGVFAVDVEVQFGAKTCKVVPVA
jgi:hypothetical protein